MAIRLQDEIQQRVPLRPTAEAMLSILRTAAMLEHRVGEALKPHGITMTQLNVLRILRGAGPAGLCGREVADRMVAQVPDIPRLLERLEGMGLISRERDPADRRHVTARITQEGRQLLTRVIPDVEAIEIGKIAQLDAETLTSLIRGLAAVREAL